MSCDGWAALRACVVTVYVRHRGSCSPVFISCDSHAPLFSPLVRCRILLHVCSSSGAVGGSNTGGINGKDVQMRTFAKRAVIALPKPAWDAIPVFHSDELIIGSSDAPFVLSVTLPTANEVDAFVEVIARFRFVPWLQVPLSRPPRFRASMLCKLQHSHCSQVSAAGHQPVQSVRLVQVRASVVVCRHAACAHLPGMWFPQSRQFTSVRTSGARM